MKCLLLTLAMLALAASVFAAERQGRQLQERR